MLYEEGNLVPSEKEVKLKLYINKLFNDLYNNEKIEVDSENLLELLSYLTSDETISTQMKTCVEVQNRIITDILHKREVEHLKKYIEYLKENSIPKQKVKEILIEIQEEYNKLDKEIDKQIKDKNKDYYKCKENIAIMQTLAYCRDKFEGLLKEK